MSVDVKQTEARVRKDFEDYQKSILDKAKRISPYVVINKKEKHDPIQAVLYNPIVKDYYYANISYRIIMESLFEWDKNGQSKFIEDLYYAEENIFNIMTCGYEFEKIYEAITKVLASNVSNVINSFKDETEYQYVNLNSEEQKNELGIAKKWYNDVLTMKYKKERQKFIVDTKSTDTTNHFDKSTDVLMIDTEKPREEWVLKLFDDWAVNSVIYSYLINFIYNRVPQKYEEEDALIFEHANEIADALLSRKNSLKIDNEIKSSLKNVLEGFL